MTVPVEVLGLSVGVAAALVLVALGLAQVFHHTSRREWSGVVVAVLTGAAGAFCAGLFLAMLEAVCN